MAIDEGLSKKIGPLPAGVWAAAIGAGLLLSIYMSRQNAKKAVPAQVDMSAPAGSDQVGNGSVGGWFNNMTPTATVSGAASNNYADNEAWRKAATNYLISQGYDAVASDTAVRRYLNGEPVDTTEQPLIDAVLRYMGPPPERLSSTPPPVTPPSTTPPTTTPPPPTTSGDNNPPAHHGGGFFFSWIFDWILGPFEVKGNFDQGDNSNVTNNAPAPTPPPNTTTAPPQNGSQPTVYVTVEGDTLNGIALKIYGSSLQATKIYNANLDKIHDPNNVPAGITITIPR